MRFPIRRLFGLVIATLLAEPSFGDCVFVNASTSPNSVVAFQVLGDGGLATVAGSPFATAGGDGGRGLLVVGDRLYVANSFQNMAGTTGSVSGFTIASNCSLTLLPGSPWTTGSSTSGLVANATGSRLFVGSFNDGEISVFDIAGNGNLTPIAGSPFATDGNPFELEIAPGGDHLFVSHLFNGTGSYNVAGGGGLSPVAGSPFSNGLNQAMVGTDLTQSGARLYVADRDQDQIAGFSVDGAGALTHLAGSPYAAVVGPDDLMLNPTEDRIFVNSGPGSLGVYAVAANGSLSPIAGSPFATGAPDLSGLTGDPLGLYIYSASGFEANPDRVYGFSIGIDGTPTPLPGSPFAMGTAGGGPNRLAYYAQQDQVPSAQPVPTVSAAGLAALAALLLAGGMVVLRRARQGDFL